MKKVIALSLLIFGLGTSFVSTSTWAQEDDKNRTVNPGEDPNEARGTKAFEADVAAPGTCPECIARMKHNRLGDDTTYRAKGSAGSDKTGTSSTPDGTR